MSTAVAVKQDSTLKGYLTARRDTIAEACVHGVSPDRLIKTACLLVTSKNGEKLSECKPESILRAITDCARFGIDPAFGRAYIIPYGREAELQLGYLGLIELAKRSGEIKSIVAGLVQEGDDFEVEAGTNPRFSHRPKFEGDGNSFKHVYALAMFADGHFEYTVLSREDVEHIRKSFSKAPNSPAWAKSYGEMAKKCAIRRLSKTLPLTIEAMEAISEDDRRNTVFDIEPIPTNGKSASAAKLDKALGLDKKEPAAEVLDVEPQAREREPGEDDDDIPFPD